MCQEKILVVGGSGFIGTPIVEELSLNKYNVFATSYTKNRTFISFDLLNKQSWLNILDTYKPTTVIATAWETQHKEYWYKSSNQDYMDATLGFAALCFENSVEKFIGLGSSSEYGYSPGVCNKDTTELNPFGFYSECKALTGLKLFELSQKYGKSSNWIRIFQPYGSFEKVDRLVPKLMNSIYSNKKVAISFPRHLLDFTYTKNLANGVLHIFQNQLDHFVDLGAGEPLTVERFATEIATSLGRELLLDTRFLDIENVRICYVDGRAEMFTSGWQPPYSSRVSIQNHCENYLNSLKVY